MWDSKLHLSRYVVCTWMVQREGVHCSIFSPQQKKYPTDFSFRAQEMARSCEAWDLRLDPQSHIKRQVFTDSKRGGSGQADPKSSLASLSRALVKFQANERFCLKQKVETPKEWYTRLSFQNCTHVHACIDTHLCTLTHEHTHKSKN